MDKLFDARNVFSSEAREMLERQLQDQVAHSIASEENLVARAIRMEAAISFFTACHKDFNAEKFAWRCGCGYIMADHQQSPRSVSDAETIQGRSQPK